MLTHSKLKALVDYDPLTGVFTRKVIWGTRHKLGEVVGSKDSYGYLKMMHQGIRYKMHRLAWFYMTEEWPELEIDHINGVPGDNRFGNLRHVTHQQNLANRANITKTNKCGCVGVSYDKYRGKYRAYHTSHGKQTLIGRFDTLEDAILARKEYVYTLQQG